jgi:GT2 family glycosyltransferase
MYTSTIICTKNRPGELFCCLMTIIYQKIQPDEIIIVDSSNNENKKELIGVINKIKNTKLLQSEIKIIDSISSLPHQRNIGIDNLNPKSELVFFFDDDSIIIPGYFKAIIDVATEHEEASGFFGVTIDKFTPKYSFTLNLFKRILHVTNTIGTSSKLLKSFTASFRRKFNAPICPSEIMNGNMVCRSNVFQDIRFDENLKGYACAEDIDFSYRMSRKYKIYQVANAFIFHNHSTNERLGLKENYYMQGTNQKYLFEKNIKQNKITRLLFKWSIIGNFIYIMTKYREKGLVYAKSFFDGLHKGRLK